MNYKCHIMKKNNATGAGDEIGLENGFFMLKYRNDDDMAQQIVKDIDSSFIQFHFGIQGNSTFYFNANSYTLNVEKEKALLLYNPQRDLPINLEIHPGSELVSVLISIRKFHSLFSEEAGYVDFLNAENRDKKYYRDSEITPAMALVLHQLLNSTIHKSIRKLYIKAKIYELLSLYFNKPEDGSAEQCPFLTDEDYIVKIRKAKDIIISRITEPPGLQSLANEVGLNLKKLKVGFKQTYGTTVYGFLFDYKMEYARKMLESGNYNVNEISVKTGYSTPSHFITGFKKKYGTTPKKYLTGLAEKTIH